MCFFTIWTSSYRNELYKPKKGGVPSVIRSTRAGRHNAIEQYRGQTERCNQRSVHIVLLFLFFLFLTNSELNYRCYKNFCWRNWCHCWRRRRAGCCRRPQRWRPTRRRIWSHWRVLARCCWIPGFNTKLGVDAKLRFQLPAKPAKSTSARRSKLRL